MCEPNWRNYSSKMTHRNRRGIRALFHAVYVVILGLTIPPSLLLRADQVIE
jgi:hypothetical protein